MSNKAHNQYEASKKLVDAHKSWLAVVFGDDAYGRTALQRFVDSSLDGLIACIIAVNTAFTLVALQWRGSKNDIELGLRDSDEWPDIGVLIYPVEHVFNAIFIIEMIMRFIVLRTKYFYEKSNMLDFVIVLITSFDLYLSPLFFNAANVNLSFARMLSLVRLVRVMRFARVLKFISPLRVLLFTIVSSFGALIWSMVMLMILQLVAAIFICQALQGTIADESYDLSVRIWANRYYGSGSKSLYSLFELTFSGCWPTYARPLVEQVHGAYSIFFLVYITCVAFGVMRIVSALFLQETMKASERDVEWMVQKKIGDTTAFLKKISDLFVAADEDESGFLNQREFEKVLCNDKVKAYLAAIDIEVFEVDSLFRLLSGGDDLISYEEFLEGIMRLKGTARSQDVIAILHNIHELRKDVLHMQGSSSDIEHRKIEPVRKVARALTPLDI